MQCETKYEHFVFVFAAMGGKLLVIVDPCLGYEIIFQT